MAERLIFLGDLMIGRGVSRALQRRDPGWFWGDALGILADADAVFGNLECSITLQARRHFWKWFHFRAVPAAVEILKAGHLSFVSLANNHILDFGAAGLEDTLAILDRHAIAHAGAGMTLSEASRPALIDPGGAAVGVIAASDQKRAFAASDRTAGTFHIAIDGPQSIAQIEPAIRTLKAQGAKTLVLSIHWGRNLRNRPHARFRTFAKTAIEAGVHIVHGHSAHLAQGAERHSGGLILYDTGNFIDDYWKFPFLPDDRSFVFRVDRHEGGALDLRLTPVRVHPMPVTILDGVNGEAQRRRMIESCAALGSRMVEDRGDLVLA